MKACLLWIVCLIIALPAAQAKHGKGSIRIEYTTTRKTFEDPSRSKVTRSTTESKSFETEFVFLSHRTRKDLEFLMKSPKQEGQFEERVIWAVNHTSMPDDGRTIGKDIPTHSIRMKYLSETQEIDPCTGEGLILISTQSFEGPIRDKILDVVIAMAGDRSALRIHPQSRGGSFAKKYSASRRSVEADHSTGDCKHKATESTMQFSDEWVNPPETSGRRNSNEDGAISIAEPAEISFPEFMKYLDAPDQVHKFVAPFTERYEYGTDFSETKGTITLILGSEPEGEIILSMEGNYDAWLPAPNQDFTPAKLIVKAKVDAKDAKPTRMRLTLGDPTRYAGIATNYPVDGKSSLDMFFPREQPNGIEWVDSMTVTTKDKVKEVSANVAVADFAASAKLYAASLDESYGTREQDGDLTYLQLPKDRDGDNVADGWEAQHGSLTHEATWDNDQFPTGQKRQGDGYTMFEEYRGFIVERNAEYDASGSMITGKHVRTDPDHKDLYVYDPDGLVKQYFEPHSPAKLNLHYVTPTTMKFTGEARNPRNRVVNTNTPASLKYADQYGLYVVRWTAMDGGQTLGVSSDVESLEILEGVNGRSSEWDPKDRELGQFLLKNNYLVKVAATFIENHSGPKTTVRDLTKTVIHEVGHAIGIPHHVTPGLAEDVEKGDSDEIIAQKDRAKRIGISDCAMRYRSEEESTHRIPPVLQNRYCIETEMFKVNDPSTNAFVDLPAHNCFGQIDVKSDP